LKLRLRLRWCSIDQVVDVVRCGPFRHQPHDLVPVDAGVSDQTVQSFILGWRQQDRAGLSPALLHTRRVLLLLKEVDAVATHGAQFSDTIVDEIRTILAERYPEFWGRPMLWDPFAGRGVKLARMSWGYTDGLGFNYGGTEIEASFIEDDNIRHGSATDPDTYPSTPHIIVTSPVYPNGMADSWKMSDGSKRHTYRSWIAENEGKDRQLDDENMGRYGYRGTRRDGASTKRDAYWDIAERSVKNWSAAEAVVLNVSDFISGGGLEPFTADWVRLMTKYGWQPVDSRRVRTPRQGHGANRDVRVEFEMVFVFEQQ
jgi:hypothetical protein